MSKKIATEQEAAAMAGSTLDSQRGCTTKKAHELGLMIGGISLTDNQLVPLENMMAEPIDFRFENPLTFFQSTQAFIFVYLSASINYYNKSWDEIIDGDSASFLYDTLGNSGTIPQTSYDTDLTRYSHINKWQNGNTLLVDRNGVLTISLDFGANSFTPTADIDLLSYPSLTMQLGGYSFYINLRNSDVKYTYTDTYNGFQGRFEIPMSAKVIEDPNSDDAMSLNEVWSKYATVGDEFTVGINVNIKFKAK